MSALTERLLKRAKEDRQCADNSAVVADALSGQMERIEARDEQRPWNTYAVRMAVDHRNSVKRDTQYADDLNEAVSIIAEMQASLKEFVEAAERTGIKHDALRNRVERARSAISRAEVSP